jgi:F-type H+-transporting ATPase subunit b
MTLPRIIPTVLLALVLAAPALAQEHAPPSPAAQGAGAAHGAQPAHPAEPGEHAEDGGGLMTMAARLLNFGILVGVLVYFLRSPFAAYLISRSSQIRQDLVTAADMRAAATAQLAEIERRMQALPGELDALRRQGGEDVQAEQARIAKTAVEERTRLLDQTRREIETRLRVARRELTAHAAQLAVGVAEQRIRRAITPDDQARLLERYASQLREAR